LTFATAGAYTITIVAKDSAGQSTTFTSTLNVIQDRPPEIQNVTLSIGSTNLNPVNGQTYTVTAALPVQGILSFTALDDIGLASVVVKLDGQNIGSNSPVNLTFSSPGDYVVSIIATDTSGQLTTYTFTLKITTVAQIIQFNFQAGTNMFGFPLYSDMTISQLLPGLNVYRKVGSSWVLENNEKPIPYAVYRTSVSKAQTFNLTGQLFPQSSITIPANTSYYLSLPTTQIVNANSLFGASLKSIQVVGTNGALTPVKDGNMIPGKVYVVTLSQPVTITLP